MTAPLTAGTAGTCPSCGVAVVAGYVKCPKCGHRLPVARLKRPTAAGGGTAMPTESKFPVVPVVVLAAIAVAVITTLALRDTKAPQRAPVVDRRVAPVEPEDVDAGPDVELTEPVAVPRGPSATSVAADLERELRRERLWGTVEVAGSRVDVRTGACSDPKTKTLVDGATASLRQAGLTKLRCVEQSGAVAFERDL